MAFRIIGCLLLALSFVAFLGGAWGVTVEHDWSVLKIAAFLLIAGVGLFALGSKKAASAPEVWKQSLGGVFLFLQIILLPAIALNFLGLVFGGKNWWLRAGGELIAVGAFIGLWIVRKRLSLPKNPPAD